MQAAAAIRAQFRDSDEFKLQREAIRAIAGCLTLEQRQLPEIKSFLEYDSKVQDIIGSVAETTEDSSMTADITSGKTYTVKVERTGPETGKEEES